MTLILSVATNRAVVQITDCRLVTRTGVETDHANKMVIARCADALVVVSYSGISRVEQGLDEQLTDEWLRDEFVGCLSGS